ncbi:hypothetical protein ATO3_02580 [Marinibacterium profundimaris]|uniref:Uncharacterized protein n=1 Tax=Marinibacterium profundimaris TaxID=1679460 RepID=A0A225NRW7_9RHOB|nr:hypothetical protein ATO3_02580 [Marinibacterium profundimaris]
MLRGMIPLLAYWNRRRSWHLALAAILLMVGGAGRSIYWEGVSIALDAEARRAFRAQLGGMDVNVVFNSILIWSAIHWLKLLHLMIPENERGRWSIWTAPCWPSSGFSFDGLRDLWRNLRR